MHFSQVRLVEPITVEGLQKIANLEAIGVLAEGLKTKSDDVSELARAALIRIQSETGDPEVRQEADHLLNKH
jgi:hypothetical protein